MIKRWLQWRCVCFISSKLHATGKYSIKNSRTKGFMLLYTLHGDASSYVSSLVAGSENSFVKQRMLLLLPQV